MAGRVILLGLALLGCLAGRCLAAEPRNLVLITLDTTRADYLGINGGQEVETPHLDRLAREGVNFTRARAPVPLTLPSHASIFTGKYPPEHGVRDNGAYRLPEGETTLAEILKERGYTTAAFVGSFVLDRRFGLSQGFEVYDDRTWTDPAMLESFDAERDALSVHRAFQEWLGKAPGDSPFFAWVHLYDPHAPYAPPEPYRSRYRNPYAGELAYTDAGVGRIVGDLSSRGLLEKTVIAVVGDHGEGLGEHGESTHSVFIYNSTLHVPMFIRAPGLVPPGRTVDALTRIIDLAPTLLDYLGIEGELGRGVSLRSHVEGRETVAIDSYSESLYPRLNLGWSELIGLEAGNDRLILAPRPELYDLAQDPGESRNRIEERAATARELRRKLEELRGGWKATEEAAGTIDPASEEKLRSLGYVTGARRARAPEEGEVDPKDKIALWNQIQLAIFQLGRDDLAGGAETLEAVLREDPDIPLVYEHLGSAYTRLERWADAEAVYRKALERGIESAEFHVQLGLAHARRGEAEPAIRELQIALALDELHVTAHFHLASLHRDRRENESAVEHYRRAVTINPDYVYAWNGLGMTLARMGRDEEALAAFRESVRIEPEGAQAQFNLAVQLERMGRFEEAIAAYRRFLDLTAAGELAPQRERARQALVRLEAPGREEIP